MDSDDDLAPGPDTPGTVPAVLAPVLVAIGFLVAVTLHGDLASGPALAGIGLIGLVGFFAALGLGARVRRRVLRKPVREVRPVWPDGGMRLVVEAIPEPCYLADARGRVRCSNAAASATFGAIQPGDPFSFRLRAPVVLEAIDRVAAGEPATRIGWSERVPTDRWFEAYIAPIALPGRERRTGRPDFLLIIVRDLSEQRRLETLRADFVANASHELRTPLASLTGFIETLQGPARRDEAARERFLAIMAEQARRMGRLIDDLLHLSRIEMRAHIRPSETVDLASVVATVLDGLEPLAAELEVSIARDLPASGPLVRGDRDELVQVVENLAENALKYGASGRRVEVSCRLDDSSAKPVAVLAVRDFGPGIAPEHQPRLTERFYRVDVATSRAQRGTGLGLSIVKHILARHGGRLAVESQPGKGATFLVRLDCLPGQAPAPLPLPDAGEMNEIKALDVHKTTMGES
ncbi:ATP-binding protein [Pseudoxanthobacter sp.]|uniref:ATP-binding protein n=1 Tax=Pseudoxanthobacter sp. TaxID=1925742 RepID=UPI002FE1883A